MRVRWNILQVISLSGSIVEDWHNTVLQTLAVSGYTSEAQAELEHDILLFGKDNADPCKVCLKEEASESRFICVKINPVVKLENDVVMKMKAISKPKAQHMQDISNLK